MANPGTTVLGITVAALLGVGALAWKAADSAPDDRQGAVASSAPPEAPQSGTPEAPPTPTAPPVPANSGSGKRVVYSVGQSMVWLVDVEGGQEKVLRWYSVVGGTVPIPVGSYRVDTKNEGPQRAGDGLTISHTVIIGKTNGYTLGFSGTETSLEEVAKLYAPSAVPSGTATGKATGTTRPSSKVPKNAGVREAAGDGRAMFEFTDIGSPVIVVQ
ncbi:hypothetical protein LO772_13905 [Yinghuangia sp. ASG 101]|uniref:hypothetical protein n=1 Tax=Yinghuangia sp. ASG 101 TaxID=2896848 RepID=UPI001E60E39E|nr:hypothetical protein [Yinghuangia sp. ASG 101]UGQ14578.1 hypothetical protein LO772_13905 [Yinghuangia sp. ASG 101]